MILERQLTPAEYPLCLLDSKTKFIFKRQSESNTGDAEDHHTPKVESNLKARRETAREMAAKYFENSQKAYSFVGSPHYMAPEIIRKVGYDELVDFWSVGCIAYEMLYRFPPFNGETPQEVFANILNHETVEFPEDEEFSISPQAKDLIQKYTFDFQFLDLQNFNSLK